MCDYFLQKMESDQAGDLTDIVRVGGAIPGGAADFPSTASEWQLPGAEPMLFPPPPSSSDGAGPSDDPFGDPFAGLPDPFSSDYPSSSAAADFFDAVPDEMDVGMAKVGFDAAVGVSGGGGGGGILDMRKPILPRGIQMPAVSPLSPRATRPYLVVDRDMVKLGVPLAAGQSASMPCAIDAVAGMPILSPRASGIKRRKNQARKVVCIPAPAAAGGGGRTSGEVVPSDLWAWRKYGQKPIKGSPYPRGYYRCSSSKGCSARKQVERSRTDPNMLVITYTSEHNHPWPTQRNALAGSTRPQHTKNSSSNNNNSSSKNSPHHQKQNVKEEFRDQTAAAATATAATTSSTITTGTTTTSTPLMVVKEEAMVGSEMEKAMDDTSVVVDHNELMHHVFNQSYKPMISDGCHPDDFFADLAELESDPMSLIFSKPSGDPDQEKAIGKDLDPFNMLDWSTTTITTSAGSSLEQRERG